MAVKRMEALRDKETIEGSWASLYNTTASEMAQVLLRRTPRYLDASEFECALVRPQIDEWNFKHTKKLVLPSDSFYRTPLSSE